MSDVMGLAFLFWMVLLKEKAVSDAQSVTFGGRSGERNKPCGVISIREHIFSKLLQREIKR